MQAIGTAAKWAGRAAALLLLLFWGVFFIEHVGEWFLQPHRAYPPAWVWVGQILHFGVMVGFGLMLRWEKAGTIVMCTAAVSFFVLIFSRVRVPPQLPYLILMNLVPVAFFAVSWTVSRRLG